jgi:hypothetical protein
MTQFPDPHLKCDGCGEMIDPDTCWCGQPKNRHMLENHDYVPMGCDCYRDKGQNRVGHINIFTLN